VRNWQPQYKLIGGYAIGAAAYLAGLALSAVFDLPSGAVIVWCLAGCGILGNLAALRRLR